MDSKAGDTWSTVPTDASTVQQIVSVGAHLGPSVGSQEIQPARKLLFDLGLEAMIEAVAIGGGIARALPEIPKGTEVRSGLAGGQDGGHNLGHIVGARENL